jgi:mannose-6-phosphate isomerase class I
MTEAERLQRADPRTIAELGTQPIRLRKDKLIERPWGGTRLPAFKHLPGADVRFGESFEVSADPSDSEAGANPSIAVFDDGSEMPLPELLACASTQILGVQACPSGPRAALPLLPKFLDIKSLLSVQAHPPGNPECYVILEAEPGAALRVGFRRAMQREALIRDCLAGRRDQQSLSDLLQSPCADSADLQRVLAPLLARRVIDADALVLAIKPLLRQPGLAAHARELLARLHACYWSMLDCLNEIQLKPGQVIFNATPDRLRGDGAYCAEVHALGNPEEREVLMLEIRRPGLTFRAWDHVRFPLRAIDIDRAVDAMNLSPTGADEFMATELSRTRPGTSRRLVSCTPFTVDHVVPVAGGPVTLDTGGLPMTLHGIGGSVWLHDAAADQPGSPLARGESVLIPASVGRYQVRTDASGGQLIAVRVQI